MRISKKVVSLLLAVLLVTALVPMAAVSANAEGDSVDVATVNDFITALAGDKSTVNVTADLAFTSAVNLDLNGKQINLGDYSMYFGGLSTMSFSITNSNSKEAVITSNNEAMYVQYIARVRLYNNVKVHSNNSNAIVFDSMIDLYIEGATVEAPNGAAVLAYKAGAQFLNPYNNTYYSKTKTGAFYANSGYLSGKYIINGAAVSENATKKPTLYINNGTFNFTEDFSDDYDNFTISTYYSTPGFKGGKYSKDITSSGKIVSSTMMIKDTDGYYSFVGKIFDRDSFYQVLTTKFYTDAYVIESFDFSRASGSPRINITANDIVKNIYGQGKTITYDSSMVSDQFIEINASTKLAFYDLTVDGNNKSSGFYYNLTSDYGAYTQQELTENSNLILKNCNFYNFAGDTAGDDDGNSVILTRAYQPFTIEGCFFTNNKMTDPYGGSDVFVATCSNGVIKDSTLNGSVYCNLDGTRTNSEKFEITGSSIGKMYLEQNSDTPENTDFYSFAITKFENSTVKEIVVENPGTTEDDLDKILCRDATTHDNEGGVYIAKDTSGNVIDKTTTLYNDYQFRKMSDEDIVGLLGNEFKLGDDFTVSNSIGSLGTSNQKNFTLDLNGKTVTITNGQGHLERRGNNNELTINDSVGGGGITTTNGYSFVLNNGMKVTVNGGNIKNTVNDVFYIYSGSADINGGDFEYPEEKSVAAGYNTSGLTVYGGTFSDNVYSFITKNTDGVFNIREANGSNTTFTTAEALGYNMTQEADDTAKDWSAIPASCFKNLQMVGLQKKNAASTSTKADGNDYQTKGMRFVTLVNEGLLKSANIADYGYVVAKVSGKTQAGIGEKFANLKYNGSNGEKTVSCMSSSNSLSGDYGEYTKSTTYKYVTLAVNGMSGGDQAVARFYIKTTDGKVFYADYTDDNNVVYSGMLATMS